MKKIFGITLAAALLGLLVSCGGAMASNPLCGKWKDNILQTTIYEFNGNGTYKYTPTDIIDSVYFDGDWSTEGSTLTLSQKKSHSLGFTFDDPFTYSYTYSVSGNSATINSIPYSKM